MSKQRHDRPRGCSSQACRNIFARLLLVPLAAGCLGDLGSPGPSANPTTGTVLVRVTTVGPDQDQNGYVIVLDGRAIAKTSTASAMLPVPALVFGQHTVSITDIASNCVADVDTVTVTISAADLSPVADLHVTCVSLGVVRYTVVTTGSDIDENGYYVVARGVNGGDIAGIPVPANGTRQTAGLSAGSYQVFLQDLAANCRVVGDLSPAVSVSTAMTTNVTLAILCTPAGRLAYTVVTESGDQDIFAVRANGAGITRLTGGLGRDDDVTWSPDGQAIAFTSDRDGVRAVYVMNDDGTNVVRLTTSPSANYQPTWSPDGRRIAFTSERDMNAEIYVMDRDGSNLTRLTHDAASDREPAWSPDGSRIAFSSDRTGQFEIHSMNVDGSSVARLTINTVWDGQPAWSPDGTSLAFARTRCDIPLPAYCHPVVVLMTGSVETREVGIGEHPAWSPDGLLLAATRFACAYDFYYPLSDCTRAGLGIYGVAPPPAPLFEMWTPVLTDGPRSNPTWRP